MLLIFRVLQNAVAMPPFPVQEIELGLRAYMGGRNQQRLPALASISTEGFPEMAELAEIPF